MRYSMKKEETNPRFKRVMKSIGKGVGRFDKDLKGTKINRLKGIRFKKSVSF